MEKGEIIVTKWIQHHVIRLFQLANKAYLKNGLVGELS